MDGLQTALDVPRPTAQEPSSLPRAALLVACFYGSIPSCAARSRCNGARPRIAGRLLPVSCRHAFRHDAATPPNPVCGMFEGQVTYAPTPPGLVHRYTLATPTLNRLAASALLPPSRTKSTTRLRTSNEHLMPLSFQSSNHLAISDFGLGYSSLLKNSLS